jgi:hypothetical protein
MTTAKPQHVNDQSDAADDLIAELAKLMAQDAQGDRAQQQARDQAAAEDHARKAEPAPDNTFAFRLPGDTAPAQSADAPKPRFDFGETGKPADTPAAPVAAQSQAPAQPQPGSGVEPGAFDAGLSSKPVAPSAEDAPPAGHDAIADLIEAEFSPEPVAQEPQAPAAPEPRVADAPRERGGDTFKVAPVFGLSGPSGRPDAAPRQPQAAQPAAPEPQDDAASDPINAIESLIGDAVRAQVTRTEAEPAQPANANPSPALRSLATPVLPPSQPPFQSQSAEASEPDQAMSAEDAILAAAAATGAQVGWVDPQESVDYIAEDEQPRRAPRRNLRAFAGPAVALVALLAAGVGLYTVLGMGGTDGPPPLLTADAAPVKEVPEAQPAAEAEPESVVFNEIAGTETPAEDEQLVSRDQSQMASIAGSPPAADATDEGLVNRKVRTVTVRPDGTIVGGQDALAGTAMLPVERPNVPELPGAAPPADTANVAATAAPATTGDAPTIETAAVNPDAATVPGATSTDTDASATVSAEQLLVPGQPASVVDASGNAIAGRTAPVPMTPITRPSEPTGAPVAIATSPINALVDPATQAAATLPQQQPTATQPAAATTQQASTAPANDQPDTLAELISAWSADNQQPAAAATPAAAPAAAQPAATQTAATAPAQATTQAPAYVQLSSQRSAEAAQQTVTTLQNRYGSLFGGAPLEIQRVDLGDRGVYYRVRLPAQSLDSATQICNSVKAGGGDCFTL